MEDWLDFWKPEDMLLQQQCCWLSLYLLAISRMPCRRRLGCYVAECA